MSARARHRSRTASSSRDGTRTDASIPARIASAFIEGTTLADALGEGGQAFDPDRAARVVRALAEALAYAHEQGVVHRDVKPANVMLDGKGQPLLMDFGLASRKAVESKLTNDGAVMGTPAYMAPEQARALEVGPRADIFALGVVAYRALTGAPPFSGDTSVEILFKVWHAMPLAPSSVTWFRLAVSRTELTARVLSRGTGGSWATEEAPEPPAGSTSSGSCSYSMSLQTSDQSTNPLPARTARSSRSKAPLLRKKAMICWTAFMFRESTMLPIGAATHDDT